MPTKTYTPAALRFIVIDFTYTCGDHQCTFWCKTDVACHLYAHVTEQRPIIRRIPYQKRGAQFVLSSVTCFVEIDAIEQEEEGDTLEHTFIIPFPVNDHTYYWYLTGTISGEPCLSISQIFWHSCPAIIEPTVRCCATEAPYWYASWYNCYDHSSAFRPLATYKCTSVTVKYKRTSSKPQCHKGRLWIFYTNADGKPTTILTGPYSFTLDDLAVGESKEVNVPINPTILNAGNDYAVVWGTRDKTIGPNYWGQPLVAFVRASGLTCEAPPHHQYFRAYDRIEDQPCGALTENWQLYPYDDNLWFETYGLEV